MKKGKKEKMEREEVESEAFTILQCYSERSALTHALTQNERVREIE